MEYAVELNQLIKWTLVKMELDKKQLRKQLIQMRLAFDDYQKQSHFIIEKLKKGSTFH